MQMTAVAEAASNVHLMGVEGGSDDLDVPLERLFCERAFKVRPYSTLLHLAVPHCALGLARPYCTLPHLTVP